jgi:hypothetical protein
MMGAVAPAAPLERLADSTGRIRGVRAVLVAAITRDDWPLTDELLEVLVKVCERVMFDLAVAERDLALIAA